MLCNKRSPRNEKPTHPPASESSPQLPQLEKTQAQRASPATYNSLVKKNHPNDQYSIPPYLEKSITVPRLILMLKSTHTYTLMHCGGEA